MRPWGPLRRIQKQKNYWCVRSGKIDLDLHGPRKRLEYPKFSDKLRRLFPYACEENTSKPVANFGVRKATEVWQPVAEELRGIGMHSTLSWMRNRANLPFWPVSLSKMETRVLFACLSHRIGRPCQCVLPTEARLDPRPSSSLMRGNCLSKITKMWSMRTDARRRGALN